MAIIFQNEGLLDPRAFTIFGLNAKPGNTSPIGYFGTGLKYAIAVLLREGQEITIVTGQDIFEFKLIDSNFRGKEFKSIIAVRNDTTEIELPFTTELGKNWQLWQAYRELYCNCMDEKGKVYDEEIPPAGGLIPIDGFDPITSTTIVVNGAEFENVHQNRGDFILQTDPIHKFSYFDLHPGSTPKIYFNGILVGKNYINYPTKYTFNFHSKVTLTEDRTISNNYTLLDSAFKEILNSENEEVIREIFTAPKNSFEEYERTIYPGELAETAARILMEIWDVAKVSLTKNAFEIAADIARKSTPENEMQCSDIEDEMTRMAKVFLGKMGYKVVAPIIVVDELSNGAIGRAQNNKIYLAQRTFEMGQKQLVITLLEEHLHITKGFLDESRAFQDYLLTKIVSLGAKIIGEIL